MSLHPLVKTLAQVSTLGEPFVAPLAPLEEGWFRASELPRDDSLLAEGLQRTARPYGTMDSRTQGAFFIGAYVWYVSATAIACYLSEGPVPSLAPENVALRYHTYTWQHEALSGQSERLEVRLLAGSFATLAHTPAASHPEATVLSERDALRGWLREQVESHLAPLITQLHVHTRLGQQAQWALVADSVAALFLQAGQALGDAERGQAEGLTFIKTAGSPLYNMRTDYVTLECAGHSESFRVHGGCCRYYRLAGNDKCSTCVLRPREEQDQLLLTYLTGKYAPAGS